MMKYHVLTDNGSFLMTAPMDTICRVFDLSQECVKRVSGELDTNQKPVIHFNGRGPRWLIGSSVQIVKA